MEEDEYDDEKKEESYDLSVDGPGSPVSLKKFIDYASPLREFNLLVDGTGGGIALDDPNTIYCTIDERRTQALWFREEIFLNRGKGKALPPYLLRWMWFFMQKEDRDTRSTGFLSSDIAFMQALQDGTIDPEGPQIKEIFNMVKYCDSNKEGCMLVGLITFMVSVMATFKKHNKSMRVYIELPETALHPSRQSKCATFLTKVTGEYGLSEPPKAVTM